MRRFLETAGFRVEAVRHSYGGQYFSVCARKTEKTVADIRPADWEELRRIREGFAATKETYLNVGPRLADLCCANENGGISLWGASAKGVMCANLLKIPSLSAVIDSNPFKQGYFIPGTGTPVIAPADLTVRRISTALVENDVYMDEITRTASGFDPGVKVLSLSRLLGLGSSW